MQEKCINCRFFKKETDYFGKCDKVLNMVSIMNDYNGTDGTYLMVRNEFSCNQHSKPKIFEMGIVGHVGHGATMAMSAIMAKSNQPILVIDDINKKMDETLMKLVAESHRKDMLKPISLLSGDKEKKKKKSGSNITLKKKKRK